MRFKGSIAFTRDPATVHSMQAAHGSTFFIAARRSLFLKLCTVFTDDCRRRIHVQKNISKPKVSNNLSMILFVILSSQKNFEPADINLPPMARSSLFTVFFLFRYFSCVITVPVPLQRSNGK